MIKDTIKRDKYFLSLVIFLKITQENVIFGNLSIQDWYNINIPYYKFSIFFN